MRMRMRMRMMRGEVGRRAYLNATLVVRKHAEEELSLGGGEVEGVHCS